MDNAIIAALKAAGERTDGTPPYVQARWTVGAPGLHLEVVTPSFARARFVSWAQIETAVDLADLLQSTENKILKGT